MKSPYVLTALLGSAPLLLCTALSRAESAAEQEALEAYPEPDGATDVPATAVESPSSELPALDAAPAPAPKPAPPRVPEPPALEPPDAMQSWRDAVEARGFVDAYAAVDYGFPKPQVGPRREVRAYDQAAGVAVAWVGVDLALPAAPVGGALEFRLGPAAERHASRCVEVLGVCDAEIGLSFVKQAYATWRPAEGPVSVDIGKFDGPFGVEKPDSQLNHSYTRGLLYWLVQPLFLTGMRLEWSVTPELAIIGYAANGYNRTYDNNAGKSLGVQSRWRLRHAEDPSRELASVSLGYLVGPEQDDYVVELCPPGQSFEAGRGCVPTPAAPGGEYRVDAAAANTDGLRHLIDLVARLRPSETLEFVANVDVAVDHVRDVLEPSVWRQKTYLGLLLGGRYAVIRPFALGARAEYLVDRDGAVVPRANGIDLVSGTFTLEARPAEGLILKFDNRVDYATKQIFQMSVRGTTGALYTTTLGVVVEAG
jgi:hypothetical protein